jgi:biopolymer transport protein TolQ
VIQAAIVAPLALFAQQTTIFRLVAEAGLFAKFILVLLLLLSIVSWGVFVEKLRLFRRIEAQARTIRLETRGHRSLLELFGLLEQGESGPFHSIVRECRRVLQGRQDDPPSLEVVRGDVQRASQKAILDSIAVLEKNLVVLSTTTTVSPFLGLLGTCWGIMVAFINIGAQGSANLSVVAPGIAEALVVTIAGLGTAIPALVFYNMLTNRVRSLETALDSFSLTVMDFVERDLRAPQVTR